MDFEGSLIAGEGIGGRIDPAFDARQSAIRHRQSEDPVAERLSSLVKTKSPGCAAAKRSAHDHHYGFNIVHRVDLDGSLNPIAKQLFHGRGCHAAQNNRIVGRSFGDYANRNRIAFVAGTDVRDLP
jgi:hypothetical protein